MEYNYTHTDSAEHLKALERFECLLALPYNACGLQTCMLQTE